MKIQIKKIVAISALALTVSACSTSRYTLDTEFDSAPVKSTTKMSEALQCLGEQLDKNKQNPSSYVFMVRDIIDGTIKHNNYSDGPLSDSGRIQMISTLSAHTRPSYGLVVDQFPIMFKPVINEQIGLDRYGLPSADNLKNFLPKLTAVANANRNVRGMSQVASVTPLIIDGAFTRNDSSHQRSKGYGQNGGYRGDVQDEESAAVDYGRSGSERSITLVVNIIDPQTNVVIGTQGFDLKYYSNSKTARFRVAINDYYYGFSNTDVRVETLHAAQQTLLEGAAVWILDNAFGNKVDFTPCFDQADTVALGRNSRSEKASAAAVASVAPIKQKESKAKPLEKPSATAQLETEKSKVEPVIEAQKQQHVLLNADGTEATSNEVSSAAVNIDESIFQTDLSSNELIASIGCVSLENGTCD